MSSRCEICGQQVAMAAGLVELRRSFSKRRVRVCHHCIRRRNAAGAAAGLLSGLGLGALGIGWVLLDPSSALGWVPLNAALVCGFVMLLIWAHEAGHALAAWSLGLRVTRICIGAGPVLFTLPLGQTSLEVRTWLSLGEVHFTYPSIRFFRLKRFVVVLCGPLVNGILLVIAVKYLLTERPLFGPSPGRWPGLVPWSMFAFANVVLLLSSLVPYRYRFADGQRANDGWQLLTIPFQPAATLAQIKLSNLLREEQWRQERVRRASSSPLGVFLIAPFQGQVPPELITAFKDLDRSDFTAARQSLQGLLYQYDLAPASHALAALAMSVALLCQLLIDDEIEEVSSPGVQGDKAGDDANLLRSLFLREAAWFAEDALKHAETSASQLRVTAQALRACILVEQGNLDAALEILQNTWGQLADRRLQAFTLSYQILAESLKGIQPLTPEGLELVRALDPNCLALRRLEGSKDRR